jgi:hypothetical protein
VFQHGGFSFIVTSSVHGQPVEWDLIDHGRQLRCSYWASWRRIIRIIAGAMVAAIEESAMLASTCYHKQIHQKPELD